MNSRAGNSLIALGVVGALLLPACSSSQTDDAGLVVVATTPILGDLAANVVGDDAAIVVLPPVGADPHDFQASAAQVATLNRADLVIANGLGLEEGLGDVLDAVASDGVRVVEIAPLLDPIPFVAADDGDRHAPGSKDPHFWFDPARMSKAAKILAAELATIEPSVNWAARADAYASELIVADEQIAQILAAIPATRRRLITNHDSLGYFANRYGWQVIGVIIPGGSTLADPSSAELAELVATMERENLTAIFAETTQPTMLADAVADELGAKAQIVELYTGSLGEPGSGAETLIDMLLTNARRIAGASGA